MKRSESVLMYGVSAVLVVILVVAVVFGDDGASAARSEGTDPVAVGGGDLDELLDDLGEDHGEGNAEENAGGEDLEEPDDDAVEIEGGDDGLVPLHVPAPSVVDVLGPFRVEENPDGARFRVVRVRPGDTFSELVVRWTASTDFNLVSALNESLDVDRIPTGTELWLPWVDDVRLLEAQEERATFVSAPPVDSGGSATPATAPQVHIVRAGESLWKIAEARVGAGAAQAFIDEVVRLNNLPNPDRVREGQKLVLPGGG